MTWHPPTMARRAVARRAPEPRTRGQSASVSTGYATADTASRTSSGRPRRDIVCSASPDVLRRSRGSRPGRAPARPCQQHCTARRGLGHPDGPAPAGGRPSARPRHARRGPRMLGLDVNRRGGARDHDTGGPAENGPGCGGGVIAGITPEQWSRPTPCTDWDVRALVTHLSDGNHLFAAALAERRVVDAGPERARGRRQRRPGGGLPGERRGGGRRVRPARCPGAGPSRCRSAPSRARWPCTCASPRSWSTAGTSLRRRGRSPPFRRTSPSRSWRFTRDALGALPPGRSPFAPPTPAPDTAPALDRLAACLGRRLPGPGRGAGRLVDDVARAARMGSLPAASEQG